ncbi:peptide-methionine (R)-S-oxide reductase MsrB [soil metagenome]
MTTRREFIGMAGVGVVALGVAGFYVFGGTDGEVPDGAFPVHHMDAEWRKRLSPASYQVLRRESTETPFTSPLLNEHRAGHFVCAGCTNQLFESRTKYDSHTGWPSFWDVMPGAVGKREDSSLGIARTEVHCADCGGHLGHVFTDGPPPTGLRYCMNGVAMAFAPAKA